MNESFTNIRHERSKKDFPHLKLEDGEYVELAFSRAKIYLTAVIGGAIVSSIILFIVFLIVMSTGSFATDMGRSFLATVFLVVIGVIVLAGLIYLRIYRGNKLFITNKRVMQFSMTSLVSSSVNIIDLKSIEDASFRQDSIVQKVLKYGPLRRSTVGDETTYTFPFSDISGEELKTIAYLVSNAKKQAHPPKPEEE